MLGLLICLYNHRLYYRNKARHSQSSAQDTVYSCLCPKVHQYQHEKFHEKRLPTAWYDPATWSERCSYLSAAEGHITASQLTMTLLEYRPGDTKHHRTSVSGKWLQLMLEFVRHTLSWSGSWSHALSCLSSFVFAFIFWFWSLKFEIWNRICEGRKLVLEFLNFW
jgi:hypothetical protein